MSDPDGWKFEKENIRKVIIRQNFRFVNCYKRDEPEFRLRLKGKICLAAGWEMVKKLLATVASKPAPVQKRSKPPESVQV
jgi:hypothetical protein